MIPSILVSLGVISLGISPYAHYRLNDGETRLITKAITQFREKVRNGKVNEIKNELAVNGRDESVQSQIVNEIKKTTDKFGEPISSDFFRARVPEDASKFYKGIDGMAYGTSYLTRTRTEEFSEHFDWLVKESGEVTLLQYWAGDLQTWEIKNRERDQWLDRDYPHEIRIPFGARFIEIRY